MGPLPGRGEIWILLHQSQRLHCFWFASLQEKIHVHPPCSPGEAQPSFCCILKLMCRSQQAWGNQALAESTIPHPHDLDHTGSSSGLGPACWWGQELPFLSRSSTP